MEKNKKERQAGIFLSGLFSLSLSPSFPRFLLVHGKRIEQVDSLDRKKGERRERIDVVRMKYLI